MPQVWGVYSHYFVIEKYDHKQGWVYVNHYSSFDYAVEDLKMFSTGEYQLRITTPMVERNPFTEKLEDIHNEHSRGLTTPSEFAERIISAVHEAI